ncbi:hypothetical protein KY343_04850 [Candidatus Woesearchaeota archaeon]|nr:hypothetical protein [Candidatus Woesearchaeota archaeon]
MGQKKIKAERRRQREEAARIAAEKPTQVPKKRNKWLLYVGGPFLAIAGTIGSILGFSSSDLEEKVSKEVVSESVEKKERISFKEAKADSSKQAEYVRNLDSIIEIPHYTASIEYKTSFEKIGEMNNLYKNNKPMMFTTTAEKGTLKDLGKKKRKGKTTVLPAAFKDSRNEAEFLVALRHEFSMAKIIHEGFDDLSMDDFFYQPPDGGKRVFLRTMWHIAAELESYDKDVERVIETRMSDFTINRFKECYIWYFNQLRKNKDYPEADVLKEKLYKLFFRKWMKDFSVEAPAEVKFRKVKSNLEDITAVQRYLDEILQNESAKVISWTGFERLIYRPVDNFDKEDSNLKTYGGKVRGDKSKFHGIAYVDIQKGNKGDCYISRGLFELARCADELKSMLDNEAFNAYCAWQLVLPECYDPYPDMKKSKRVRDMAFEAMSYDYQLARIMEGKRRVSREYRARITKSYYNSVYLNLLEVSKQDNDDGLYVRALLKGLKMKFQPTRGR